MNKIKIEDSPWIAAAMDPLNPNWFAIDDSNPLIPKLLNLVVVRLFICLTCLIFFPVFIYLKTRYQVLTPRKYIIEFASKVIKVSNLFLDYKAIRNSWYKLPIGPAPSYIRHKCNVIKDRYKRLMLSRSSEVRKAVSDIYCKLFNYDFRIDQSLYLSLIGEAQELIGSCIEEENIVDAGVFKKFGIICIKNDTPLTHSLPNNIITEEELLVMTGFLKKIGDQKDHLFQFSSDCDEKFKEKTLDNFVKILTFPQGRKLIGDLIRLMIKEKEKILLQKTGHGKGAGYSKTYDGRREISIGHKGNLYNRFKTRKLSFLIQPSWVGLPHELIHCLHSLQSVLIDNSKLKIPDKRWTNGEEFKTIGDPEKIAKLSAQELKESLTENAFLREAGYPLREYHWSVCGDIDPYKVNIKELNKLALSQERLVKETLTRQIS